MNVNVSICGTAGRGTDYNLLNLDIFNKMVSKCALFIREQCCSSKEVTLVSGGAAWADHVAIRLYLSGDYGGLRLHLPCEFKGRRFVDNGASEWYKNPGKSANEYHRRFTLKTGIDSLMEIEKVSTMPNVEFVLHNGFHERNKYIATSSLYLVAFSTANGDSPQKGGTLDTWNKAYKCKIRKHISILTIDQIPITTTTTTTIKSPTKVKSSNEVVHTAQPASKKQRVDYDL